ncbi:MAG: ATP-dependent Clp protease ATP-binding subunit [Myxococcota bacterium]|nr:ATP-dependent Clp protease ATP-binding subunit [Myxococcota bacterium]
MKGFALAHVAPQTELRHTAQHMISESSQVIRAFLEAEDIAQTSDHPLSSAHVLLALFTFPKRAQYLLEERDVDEDRILDAIRIFEEEPKRTVVRMRERGRGIAQGAGAKEVDCLHLLIAITRLKESFAYTLLERAGLPMTALRNQAVSYVTGVMPRRYRSLPKVRTDPRMLFQSRAQTQKTEVQKTGSSLRESIPKEFIESDTPPSNAPEITGEAIPEKKITVPKSAAASKDSPFDLPKQAPTLSKCGVNLTERARQGELDMVVGRENELEALVDTLGKRRSNNPILVGPPGVGKTAIAEGLAVKVARGDEDVNHFSNKVIFALDTGALIAGTSLRGAFSERMSEIKKEVAQANGRVIVFIDELHTLIGAGGTGESAQDAANELKTALARGEFPCIGATTFGEYRKYIEKDPALERRFTPIEVTEPTVDEAILILEGGITPYAEHHRVDFSLDAVHAAVGLTHRFVTERKLPDKAFSALDLAGSRARRRGKNTVDRIDVARVVHEWTQIPLERLAEVDGDRFARAEEIIGQQLIGHPQVVRCVAEAIRRGFAGFGHQRPIGSFLFLGPTGVGKTELVKVLADFLFGNKEAIVRIDMSEMTEAHSISRLIGAQPGYVGYEEGGQLTEALRKRPFQIVLFDEIEKSHPDILNILLQILDEGHLTDSKGRKVSFTNTLIVLTSNLGSEHFRPSQFRAIGFGSSNHDQASQNHAKDAALEIARAKLSPELWGRLDQQLVFAPLTEKEVAQIAELQLKSSAKVLYAEREIALQWSPQVIDFLLAQGGFSPEQGARGMRHAIQKHVEAPLASAILTGNINFGDIVHLTCPTESLALVIQAQRPQLPVEPTQNTAPL